jgi:hypothetical protein
LQQDLCTIKGILNQRITRPGNVPYEPSSEMLGEARLSGFAQFPDFLTGGNSRSLRSRPALQG